MTIRDMHIYIRAGLNQLSANRTRKYQPEELDLAINLTHDSFIRSKIRPRADHSGGFELDEINVDDIRTLIVTEKLLIPYYDNSKYLCFLPNDYQYLLADWSITKHLCGAPLPATTPVTLYLHSVRASLSDKANTPYNTSEVISLAGNSVSIPEDLNYGNGYAGVVKKEDAVTLVPWICSRYGWYWERFGNTYLPYTFLVPSELSEATDTFVADGIATTGNVQALALQRHVDNGNRTVNRLTRSNKIPNLLGTPFYKTSNKSPISELSGGLLQIYADNSFIVVEAGISYIRKCVPVSLSLGCNSELPESVHSLICDQVIQYLLLTLNSPGAQFKEADLRQRTTP